MKKIGLLSDTHGFYDPKISKYFDKCDEIWHAGDIGDLSVTDELSNLAPLRAVYGNIDNHVIRTEFPLHQKFSMEDCSFWMTHIGGKPYVYSNYVLPQININPPKVFICGHSHLCKVQFDKRLNMLYINPGAAGNSGIHLVKTLIRFCIENGTVHSMEVVELGRR